MRALMAELRELRSEVERLRWEERRQQQQQSAAAGHGSGGDRESGGSSSSSVVVESSGVEGSGRLTHTDAAGRASMVDVSSKPPTAREARASCRVLLGREAFDLVAANALAKGDVLATAQLAGVMGAKMTSALIPLCHPLLLSKADVSLSLDAPAAAVVVRSLARTSGQTGVEMEALTAAAVAALTVYDMAKAVAKGAVISDLRLDWKSGGKGGVFDRAAEGGG